MEAAPSEYMSFPEWVELGTRSGTWAELSCKFLVWFPDPSCTGGAREGREGRLGSGNQTSKFSLTEVDDATLRSKMSVCKEWPLPCNLLQPEVKVVASFIWRGGFV